ncbi:MAG: substrate-binding periplasmic protein [Parachlamydiaceae bacterium]
MSVSSRIANFFRSIARGLKNPANRRRFYIFLLIIAALLLIRSCYRTVFKTVEPYVIARDATWYPISFAGKEKNMVGFSDDLLIEIARLKKLQINLTRSSRGDLFETLDYGGADAVLTSLTPTPVTSEEYLFSSIYYPLGAVLLAEPSSQIKSLADMEGKFLGVLRGSPVLFNIAKYPPLKVVPYDRQTKMLEDIIDDKIDGALLNQLVAFNLVNGYYKGKLQIVTQPLTNEGLRVAAYHSPKNEQFIEAFNEGLEELSKSGKYQELLKKWDLYDPYSIEPQAQ